MATVEVLFVRQPCFVLAFRVIPFDIVAAESTGVSTAFVGIRSATGTCQDQSDHEGGKPTTHRILVPADLRAVKQVAGR